MIENILGVGIESPQRAQGGNEHAHRMSVVVKTVHDLLDALVNEGVMGDVPGPLFQLFLVWQLAMQQQVSDFEIVAFLGQLVDRNSPIFEDTFVAVDEGDAAFA